MKNPDVAVGLLVTLLMIYLADTGKLGQIVSLWKANSASTAATVAASVGGAIGSAGTQATPTTAGGLSGSIGGVGPVTLDPGGIVTLPDGTQITAVPK